MKAVLYDRYGPPDVLEAREIDPPMPKDDEVLVRVRAAAVNPLDWHLLTGTPYFMRLFVGFLKPKRRSPGADVAGDVVAVGESVTRYAPGDEVFGSPKGGGCAEYVCVAADRLAPKPKNLTFEQAAAVPVAAITALMALRDSGKIQPGQRVLVNGAAGGVGTFAVQIAKSMGADVTGVCSTTKVDVVRSLGADDVIDYTQQDFTRSDERYDVLVDLVGNRSLAECRRALKPKGVLVMCAGRGGKWLGPLPRMLRAMAISPFVGQRMATVISDEGHDDLVTLSELIEAGKVTPVIDRHYSLSGVPDAIRHLREGRARGKVVITV